MPVIAGTGGNGTREAIELSREAKRLGADGMLQVTPYYNKPTQDGLYRHFKAIIEAAPLPTVVYNVPGRTGCDLLPETVARLCDIKEVVAIKEATGNLQRASQIIARVGDRLVVLSGDDATAFPLFARGRARGDLGGLQRGPGGLRRRCGTRSPPATWPAARELHYRCFPLSEGLFIEANPIPVKAALAMMGKIADEIRPPLYPAERRQQGEGPQDPPRPRTGRPVAMAPSTPVRIAVLGAAGKMGQAIVRALADTAGGTLSAAVERPGSAELGRDAGLLAGLGANQITVAGRSARPPARPTSGSTSRRRRPAWPTPRRRPSGAPPWSSAPPACRRTTGRRSPRPPGSVPVVLSPNMSVGVNVLLRLVADAARALGPDYDIEVLEAHHRAKRDAPSGTALRLAEALAEATGRDLAQTARYERHGDIGPRPAEEIGLQTIRGRRRGRRSHRVLPGPGRAGGDHPQGLVARNLRPRRGPGGAVAGAAGPRACTTCATCSSFADRSGRPISSPTDAWPWRARACLLLLVGHASARAFRSVECPAPGCR